VVMFVFTTNVIRFTTNVNKTRLSLFIGQQWHIKVEVEVEVHHRKKRGRTGTSVGQGREFWKMRSIAQKNFFWVCSTKDFFFSPRYFDQKKKFFFSIVRSQTPFCRGRTGGTGEEWVYVGAALVFFCFFFLGYQCVLGATSSFFLNSSN